MKNKGVGTLVSIAKRSLSRCYFLLNLSFHVAPVKHFDLDGLPGPRWSFISPQITKPPLNSDLALLASHQTQETI